VPVVVLVALAVRVVGVPATDAVVGAEAVVVMAGSGDPGLQEGLVLVNAGVAPVLVLVRAAPGDAESLCGDGATVEVVCTDASPAEREQLRLVAGLVAERSWRSVVVVQHRAGLSATAARFGRCTDATVLRRGVAGPPGTSAVSAAMAALPDALRSLLVEKTC
jgi:hypothetical protein